MAVTRTISATPENGKYITLDDLEAFVGECRMANVPGTNFVGVDVPMEFRSPARVARLHIDTKPAPVKD